MLDEFQSTHPARGATDILALDQVKTSISIHAPREGCDIEDRDGYYWINDFNPRTPRGVRHWRICSTGGRRAISIHAPREGCDQAASRSLQPVSISIHAPREGCDDLVAKAIVQGRDFNPRTPRGVRRP